MLWDIYWAGNLVSSPPGVGPFNFLSFIFLFCKMTGFVLNGDQTFLLLMLRPLGSLCRLTTLAATFFPEKVAIIKGLSTWSLATRKYSRQTILISCLDSYPKPRWGLGVRVLESSAAVAGNRAARVQIIVQLERGLGPEHLLRCLVAFTTLYGCQYVKSTMEQ